MDLGDPLFYEMPPAEADVPLAAMRALARRRPEFSPESEFKLAPPQHRPVPDAPPMRIPTLEQAPILKSGWKGLVDQYADQQQQDNRKQDDDILARIQEIMKGAQTPPFNPDGRSVAAMPADLARYMAKNRMAESGGDDSAVNQGSGAAGRYQFLPSTWQSIMKEAPHLGLTVNGMHDAAQQDAAMKYYTAKSVAALKPLLGRAPTGGELYALHLLGHSGGSNLIQNLGKPLAELIDKRAMDANPWLYQFKTGQDLINQLNRRFS